MEPIALSPRGCPYVRAKNPGPNMTAINRNTQRQIFPINGGIEIIESQ
jgi:hypothetical protein